MLRVISQSVMQKYDTNPDLIEPGKKWEYCGFCKGKRIFLENEQTKTWKCTECGAERPIRQYGPVTITPMD